MSKGERNIPNQFPTREIRQALLALDADLVEVEGKRMKPSHCYHVELDPPHVLFNTNCPDELKEKVTQILSKYGINNESSS